MNSRFLIRSLSLLQLPAADATSPALSPGAPLTGRVAEQQTALAQALQMDDIAANIGRFLETEDDVEAFEDVVGRNVAGLFPDLFDRRLKAILAAPMARLQLANRAKGHEQKIPDFEMRTIVLASAEQAVLDLRQSDNEELSGLHRQLMVDDLRHLSVSRAVDAEVRKRLQSALNAMAYYCEQIQTLTTNALQEAQSDFSPEISQAIIQMRDDQLAICCAALHARLLRDAPLLMPSASAQLLEMATFLADQPDLAAATSYTMLDALKMRASAALTIVEEQENLWFGQNLPHEDSDA